MVIKGNGAVNTMEAVKINTKEKERTKVTYHKSVFSSVLTGITSVSYTHLTLPTIA